MPAADFRLHVRHVGDWASITGVELLRGATLPPSSTVVDDTELDVVQARRPVADLLERAA